MAVAFYVDIYIIFFNGMLIKCEHA